MLILNQNEIKQLIAMDEAIEINEIAYQSYSTGKSDVPLRYNMQLGDSENFALFMPGYVSELAGLGLKMVTIFPENVKRSLPATQGVILLCDVETGVPLALMDGTFITALRTGSGTGVATKYLARENATTLAIIGTGGMAEHQLEAICAVRDIQTVYVYNRTPEKAEKFIQDMQGKFGAKLTFLLKDTPEEAVRESDIVATTTSSPTPVVKYEWLKEGTHVNAIGAFNSELQEVDEEILIRSAINAVDSVEGASVAGDIAIPLRNGTISKNDLVEIGHIVNGDYRGRQNEREITFFKSVGLSNQDIAVAVELVKKAQSRGMGTTVEL